MLLWQMQSAHLMMGQQQQQRRCGLLALRGSGRYALTSCTAAARNSEWSIHCNRSSWP
jgi:hypothetical protein